MGLMYSANSKLGSLSALAQLTLHFRARILKHLLEAEKSAFREELSFQRSESTIGLFQATVFVYDRKDSFL
jgi:hypothetical protein